MFSSEEACRSLRILVVDEPRIRNALTVCLEGEAIRSRTSAVPKRRLWKSSSIRTTWGLGPAAAGRERNRKGRAVQRTGWSPRAVESFVAVHCPSLSKDLLESQLFGPAKGAFTGAMETSPNRVSQAEAGTRCSTRSTTGRLASSRSSCASSRTGRTSGGAATRTVDVRLLAATNQDLAAAVEVLSIDSAILYRKRKTYRLTE